MNTEKIYDVIGIGIGPFNLGLAALTQHIENFNTLFIDRNKSFQWHPGLLLPTAKMQVPFYADLVTLADPTSPYSYMNYLRVTGRLFRFAINEAYYPYRTEYHGYCQWVVRQLDNLFFGQECKSTSYDKKLRTYAVTVLETSTAKIKVLTAKHLVIDIGSVPYLPECVREEQHLNIFHASQYLQHKNIALMHKDITLIGSGQSAAEIFLDLLPHLNNLSTLKWYTRSDRFYAMDESKFALECGTPEYIQYFYALPRHKKAAILRGQHDLYKGINFSLIEEIYEQLYWRSLNKTNKLPVIRTSCELKRVTKNQDNTFTTEYLQRETEKVFEERTEVIILATGYQPAKPTFIDGIAGEIQWEENGNYHVNNDYSINNRHTLFVQNAEWHTHWFNSADLGLGPYRNARIIDSMTKTEYFSVGRAETSRHFDR